MRYGAGSSSGIEVGRKTRTVYYQKEEDGQTVIYATDVDSKATRVVSKLGFTGQFGGVNADETLIIGKRRAPAKLNHRRKHRRNRRQAQVQPAPASPPAANAPAEGRRGGRGGGGCWSSSPWTSKPGPSAHSCP